MDIVDSTVDSKDTQVSITDTLKDIGLYGIGLGSILSELSTVVTTT